MAQARSPSAATACIYSVVRAVPHPLRDESINIGVIVLASDGNYAEARFSGWGRVRKLAPDADIKSMELFLNGITSLLPMHGDQHHLLAGGQRHLDVELLGEWSRDFGGSIRVSAPRVALASNPRHLLLDLYRDLVDTRGWVEGTGKPRPVTRRDLLLNFDKTALEWKLPTAAIRANSSVHGRRAEHFVDRVFLREHGRLAALVHALSFEAPELPEVYAQRATIIVAAEDLHDVAETARLPIFALYSPANSDRLPAVQESAELFRARQVTPVQPNELRNVQEVVENRLAFST